MIYSECSNRIITALYKTEEKLVWNKCHSYCMSVKKTSVWFSVNVQVVIGDGLFHLFLQGVGHG